MIRNGRLDTAILSAVPGGRLRLDAARSWERAIEDVQRRTGYRLSPTSYGDTYRWYELQESTFRTRYRTTFTGIDPRGWDSDGNGVKETWWRLAPYAAAAVPGTSNHGLGIAVDIASMGGFTGTKYRAVSPVLLEHGWDNVEGRSIAEPWHWRYRPENDRHASLLPAPTVTAPAPLPAPQPEEYVMASRAEVRADLTEIVRAELDAERAPLFRMDGGRAAYRDLGVARRHVTKAQSDALQLAPPVDLPPSDTFWALPVVGIPGELYRLAGDETGAAFMREGVGIRHVSAAQYAGWGRPLLVDLPIEHPIGLLSKS